MQDQIVAGNTEEAEADNQHAGDGAAPEGNIEGFLDAAFGCFGGPDIGADRNEHADKAGQSGEERADGETDGGFGTERCRQKEQITNMTTPTMAMIVYWRFM